MTHLIKVTNNNDFEITDYFNGRAYVFAPEEPVNMPFDAARHIFGIDFPEDEATLKSASFREELLNSVSRRWGWTSHEQEEKNRKRKIMNKFIFTPVITKMIELVPENNDLAPAREQPAVSKGKNGKFKPRADEPIETEDSSEEEVA